MKVESESEIEVAQLCLTLSDPTDRSPPASSVHEILLARVLEWVAIAFSDDYTEEVTNRFKGLDLKGRMPEDYGQRFMTFYRRQGSRPSPRKRNAKKLNGCLRRPYK